MAFVRGTPANVGKRDRPRQNRDEFHLRAQLEVEVEQDDERDAHPNIEDEIDAAADAGPLRDVRRVIGHPGEIEAACRGND